MRALTGILRILLVWVPLLIIAALVAQWPPVRALDATFAAERATLLAITLSATVVGFVLFMGGVLDLLISAGEPGRAAGAGETFTLGALRGAVTSGAWLRDATWRRRVVVTVGALLMAVGICGLFIVIGPGYLRVIMAAVLVYAAVQLAWGLLRS